MKDLGVIFENNSDCYADCDDAVMAMTKEKFIEVVKKLLERSDNSDYAKCKHESDDIVTIKDVNYVLP